VTLRADTANNCEGFVWAARDSIGINSANITNIQPFLNGKFPSLDLSLNRCLRQTDGMPTLRITLTDGAKPPEYATPGSAGMDLRSVETFELQPMERRLARTGLRIAVPEGYEAQVRPRSGLALKHGLSMVNTPGTIDSDYRGELGVILINLGQEVVKISAGDRIAQLVICPVARVEITVVEDLDDTERGEGGFGSTGRA